MVIFKMVCPATAPVSRINCIFICKLLIVFVFPVDKIPDKQKNLAGRIDFFNIVFHACLIPIVKNNHLLCPFYMLFPVAPEYRAGRDTQKI